MAVEHPDQNVWIGMLAYASKQQNLLDRMRGWFVALWSTAGPISDLQDDDDGFVDKVLNIEEQENNVDAPYSI